LASVGTVAGTADEVSSGSCGPPELAEEAGGDTGVAFGGLTFQAAGPMGGGAVAVDGSTGWADTTVSYTDPEDFTVLVWFKTSVAQGGMLGFNSQWNPTTSVPTDHDRQLWVDPSGKLVWGIWPDQTISQLTSPSAVDTGNWVFAAASIGPAGQQLFVNGSLAASSTTYTVAQPGYTGWWSIGYANLANWNDIPTSYYFDGSVAQVAVVPSQLTAAQVSQLWGDSASSLATYTSYLGSLGPTNYWPLADTGGVPYEGAIPGATASATLADASGNADTGTAEGGTTLGAAGPSSLSASGVTLNGNSGFVETAKSYANPEGISEVAWFKTGTAGLGTGGAVMSFTSSQANTAPTSYDRTVWLDNSGKLVYGVNNATIKELTSTGTYNDGKWHMVVAEVGPAGQQLWADGALVASSPTVTSAANFTGYWHLGWGYETGWPDAPADAYFTGSLSEAAVVPSQLSAAQVATLYQAASAASFADAMAAQSPSAYWPMQDSASGICATVEVTVQETLGATTTCLYPAGAGACPALSASKLVTTLVAAAAKAPTASNAATVTLDAGLSAAAATALVGLQLLPDISFGTSLPATEWSAQIAYPYSSFQL
jgi:hypothetical protein